MYRRQINRGGGKDETALSHMEAGRVFQRESRGGWEWGPSKEAIPPPDICRRPRRCRGFPTHPPSTLRSHRELATVGHKVRKAPVTPTARRAKLPTMPARARLPPANGSGAEKATADCRAAKLAIATRAAQRLRGRIQGERRSTVDLLVWKA